jgi:hypothetical protein
MASYPSIRIEGGLLGPELLDQIVAADVQGQKPENFGLEARRNLTDEIAATFADARALWGVFQHRLSRLPENDPATSVTRDAWMIPFLGLLGYEPRYNSPSYVVDGQTFAISHRANDADDSPPIHIVGARQELGRVPASGRPRLAPHSLVQEYLNRTEYVWGVVTNGLTLRLLRNSTLVRRQAYVEFDLQEIFDEQLFTDFAALYRVLHRTRLPRGLSDTQECLLDVYYKQTIDQGGRVREHLRDGVKRALEAFANGFLDHPANGEFCSDLTGNRISAQSFYQQLLRLIYRLLFLMVSEERNLLVSRRPDQLAAAESIVPTTASPGSAAWWISSLRSPITMITGTACAPFSAACRTINLDHFSLSRRSTANSLHRSPSIVSTCATATFSPASGTCPIMWMSAPVRFAA